MVDHASTADTALQMIGLKEYDLVILQVKLPIFGGIELARQLKKLQPSLAVLPISTSISEAETGEIVRLGYPVPISSSTDNTSELIKRCQDYIETRSWFKRIDTIRNELKLAYGYDEIITDNPQITEVYERAARIANAQLPILITGESGTGKELVARMIHSVGNRSQKPFVSVNCAAIPEGLLESQFFGHEKGAFTGAVSRQSGKFEQAHRGTLFLDEISEMNLHLQAKFLRVIETGELERVGGQEILKVDVRLVTATNRDLEQMANEGEFRTDLQHRINVFPIHLSPLNERQNDIVLLAYHFLRIASGHNNRQVSGFHEDALELLKNYSWQGNIRELENSIERAVLISDSVRLRVEDFPHQLTWALSTGIIPKPKTDSEIRLLKDVERDAIVDALLKTEWNIAQTSRALGIGRNTLYRKMEEYGISQK